MGGGTRVRTGSEIGAPHATKAVTLGLAAFAVAALSSLVAVILGAGGDVLALSLFLFVLPLVSTIHLTTHVAGSLVLIQGFVTTGIAGIGYGMADGLLLADVVLGATSIAAGSLGSSIAASLLSEGALHVVFAVATTIGVVAILRQGRWLGTPLGGVTPGDPETSVARRQVSPVTAGLLFAVGGLTGALGIGGGFLIIAILAWGGTPLHRVRGLTLLLTCVNLLDSFVGHVVTGSVDWTAGGYAFAGAAVAVGVGLTVGHGVRGRPLYWGLLALISVAAARAWVSVA